MSSSNEAEPSSENFDYEIIIVGAGVAGASAAHHLSNQKDLTDKILVLDAGPDAGEGVKPRYSGSATMPNNVAPCIKMMVQLYAGSTVDFSKHHGTEGCRRYLTATREGLKLQQGIADLVWKKSEEDDTSQFIKPLGSYYVAYAQDREALREEFESLADLGKDICPGLAWIDSAEELQQVQGLQGLKFDCAIYFPNDCVIDSSEYAKAVLQHVTTNHDNVTFQPNTRVKDVVEKEENAGCVVTLESGETLSARHVVMATGGLHQDITALNGILKPCYSYLVHVPTLENLDASPNFFTWGFTHDWCFTNGSVRTSGEDHFSAYKPSLYKERCQRLSQWTLEQYGCNTDNVDYDAFGPQYGVYSETPDMAPLIGSLSSNRGSGVTYLLGCNAWGQTILSYCSSLIPGLLGYEPLTEEQRDIMKLVSIRRFSELPSSSSSSL